MKSTSPRRAAIGHRYKPDLSSGLNKSGRGQDSDSDDAVTEPRHAGQNSDAITSEFRRTFETTVLLMRRSASMLRLAPRATSRKSMVVIMTKRRTLRYNGQVPSWDEYTKGTQALKMSPDSLSSVEVSAVLGVKSSEGTLSKTGSSGGRGGHGRCSGGSASV
ncbi:hypothetical protein C8F04DRAFT_1138471 [Mycena alexandri]|uniref:Uncharacterized protein n=1 Tax=Mycena alexandri TaxID=1745969 RepID=A0AAD6S9S3_9AGAR|nr:hypothetical protein C8F04DRAFT_1138471 [Mycena alexandri]